MLKRSKRKHNKYIFLYFIDQKHSCLKAKIVAKYCAGVAVVASYKTSEQRVLSEIKRNIT